MHFFEFHFIKTGHLIHHLHLSHNSTCILTLPLAGSAILKNCELFLGDFIIAAWLTLANEFPILCKISKLSEYNFTEIHQIHLF